MRGHGVEGRGRRLARRFILTRPSLLQLGRGGPAVSAGRTRGRPLRRADSRRACAVRGDGEGRVGVVVGDDGAVESIGDVFHQARARRELHRVARLRVGTDDARQSAAIDRSGSRSRLQVGGRAMVGGVEVMRREGVFTGVGGVCRSAIQLGGGR